MRTNSLIRFLTTIATVLAISSAMLASGASAHQHRHGSTHAQRHHARRHHGRRHHGRRHHAVHAASAPVSIQLITYALPAITGRTFYVSPAGNDANSGLSSAAAWRTVHQVNKMSVNFHPGDGVLFQGGASYSDSSLEPGWGAALAGTASAPIVFGTYGSGHATLPQGVWLANSAYIVISGFNVGPSAGVSGTATNVTVQDCTIGGMVHAGSSEVAINGVGSGWLLRGDTVNGTGDSGLLLRGDHFTVTGNLIENTGLDHAISYPTHGIYLKASASTVSGNAITNFHVDGVSVRYRDSVVSGNTISGGQMGIAWFQYDASAGTSHWASNRITATTIAGIYVSPSDPTGGATRESFAISGNTISRPAGSGWVAMSLKPTTGSYNVTGNTID